MPSKSSKAPHSGGKPRSGGRRREDAPEFEKPEPPKSPLEEVRSMPETAAIALLLATLEPHLRISHVPLSTLEAALASPLEHERIWCVILSRLLIQDPQLRNVFDKDEGMDWDWVMGMLRQTVRAWYMRRHAVAQMVDTLVERCRLADYILGGDDEADEELAREARAAAGMTGKSTGRIAEQAHGQAPSAPPMPDGTASSTARDTTPPSASRKTRNMQARSKTAAEVAHSSSDHDSDASDGDESSAPSTRRGTRKSASKDTPAKRGQAATARSSGVKQRVAAKDSSGDSSDDSAQDSDSESGSSGSEEHDDAQSASSDMSSDSDAPAVDFRGGLFDGAWLPDMPYSTRGYDPDDYVDSVHLSNARARDGANAGGAIDSRASPSALAAAAGTEIEADTSARATSPASIVGAAAAASGEEINGQAGAQMPATDAESEAITDAVAGAPGVPRKRRRRELDDLWAATQQLTATSQPRAQTTPRPSLPIAATSQIGRRLTNAGIWESMQEARDAEVARVAAASEGGLAGGIYATRKSARREDESGAHSEGAVEEAPRPDPDAEPALDDSELFDALVDSRSEADELEVEELGHWDSFLSLLGGSQKDPLAKCNWWELPVRDRVLVLYAVLESRVGNENDDVHEFMVSDKVAPDSLRLAELGQDATGAVYFRYPEGMHEDCLRIYMQTAVQLKSGRRTFRWRVAASTADELRAHLASRKKALTQYAKGAAVVVAERALHSELQEVLDALVDAERQAAAHAEREAKREERLKLMALVPRRQSGRLTQKATESDAERTAEESGGRRTGITYGDANGVNILALDRPRAIGLIQRMGHVDSVRAVADLVAAQPEYERYVGMPATLLPLRPIQDTVREALQKEFATQVRDRARRRARAEKDRNRAERERRTAEERAAEFAAREEERKRNEEKLSRERQARSVRREMGLAASAIPFGADPTLYEPSGIRLQMKVLRPLRGSGVVGHGELKCLGEHNPVDAATKAPLRFPVEAFLYETLSYDIAVHPDNRDYYWDYTRPERLFAPPPPPPARTPSVKKSPAPRKTAPRGRPRKLVPAAPLAGSAPSASKPAASSSTSPSDVVAARPGAASLGPGAPLITPSLTYARPPHASMTSPPTAMHHYTPQSHAIAAGSSSAAPPSAPTPGGSSGVAHQIEAHPQQVRMAQVGPQMMPQHAPMMSPAMWAAYSNRMQHMAHQHALMQQHAAMQREYGAALASQQHAYMPHSGYAGPSFAVAPGASQQHAGAASPMVMPASMPMQYADQLPRLHASPPSFPAGSAPSDHHYAGAPFAPPAAAPPSHTIAGESRHAHALAPVAAAGDVHREEPMPDDAEATGTYAGQAYHMHAMTQ